MMASQRRVRRAQTPVACLADPLLTFAAAAPVPMETPE